MANLAADGKELRLGMAEETTPLIELGPVRFEPGYWRGLRQPSVLVTLRLTRLEVATKAVQRFDELLAAVSPPSATFSEPILIDVGVAQHPILSRVMNMTLKVLEIMGMPVMGGATALKSDAKSPQGWVVGLPAIAQGIRAPQVALGLACSLMNALADGKKVRTEDVASDIAKLSKQFLPLAPRGINTLRFLQAAHEMGIPWRHVANNVYQFGWGSRSRWLDSSFTDETSSISAGLARDKVACAQVLRMAGVPVARHQLVSTAEQAVKVADALGYPVVVKPANLDGGVGVMAGLRDALGVTKAFAVAAKYSKKILVEQFVAGEDYRIRICANEVVGVGIRKAAAVVGDGQRSVQALIELTNAERAQKMSPLVGLHEIGRKPIVVDEEVQSWLTLQGLMLDSVVPLGQRVRLRGAANVNLGGTIRDVTEKVHPDNLELALNAAAALRLDVAGVDLLLPDIAQSWKATGGAVCEVNAQPQFSSEDAHRQILKKLVRHHGRIPVVGVLKLGFDQQDLLPAMQMLQKEGVHVEIASSAHQCHQALMSQHVDALLWLVDELPRKTDALPVDAIDLLIKDTKRDEQQLPAQWVQAQQWVLSESYGKQQMIERLQTYVLDACRQHN
jgi:cyanophycin synthetase